MSYNVKVLGFGDNVVDKYEHIKTMYPGGNAVNFAVFAKKLGAERSAYMGIFGSDKEAEHVIASLQEEGVELVKCRQVIGENGAARVTVNPENGDRIFLGSNEGGIRGDMLYALDRFSIEYVKGFDLVHSGNYCFTERELPKIKAAGVPISFDFSDDSCSDISKEETYEKLKKVSALGPKFVCASRGDEGCIAFDGNEFYVQGIKPVTNMVDTMAAGDSLLTAFLVSYVSKEKEGHGGPQAIRESLDLAAGFAANTCGLAGSWGHGKVYE